MNYQGTTVVSLDSITLANLKGLERRCAECNRIFEDGDLVVAFSVGKYNNDSLPLQDVYLVHTSSTDNKFCLEEFLARFLRSLDQKEIPAVQPAVEPTNKEAGEIEPLVNPDTPQPAPEVQ